MATSEPAAAPGVPTLGNLVNPMAQPSVLDVVSMLGTVDIEATRADDRLVWMRERIATSLGTPSTGFLAHDGDNRLRAEWFLNHEEYRCLFAWDESENPADRANEESAKLTVDINPPHAQVQGKIVVFRKAGGVGIVTADVSSELAVSECNADPWQQLWNATQQVFLPILQFNAKSIDSKRIISDLQKLIATIQVTRGHTHAEFVIPQPPLILEDDDVVESRTKSKSGASDREKRAKKKQAEALGDVRASSGSRPMTQENPLPPVGGSSAPSTPKRETKAPRPPRTPHTPNSINSQSAGSLRRSVGAELNRRDRERDRIHALETTVLGWTRLVKSILKQDAIPDHVISEAGEFPGPMYEMNLRRSSAQNLKSVKEQLESDAVQTVLSSLGENNPYSLAFGVVQHDVEHAAESAQQTMQYFVTLEPWFVKISNNEATVDGIIAGIRPAVHTMLLVWQNCKYYKSHKRLAYVFQMMSNEIIAQAQSRVDAALLQANPRALLPQLHEAIRICSMLRGSYLDAKHEADALLFAERERTQAKKFAGPAKKLALWPARGDATFVRLNAFIDRCNDLTDIADTTLQYRVLQSMEIGGPKGELLTAAAKHVLDEYIYGLHEFFNLGLDILDVDKDPETFDVAYLELKLMVKRLDRRLSEILSSSFTEDLTLPEQLKLVISYKEFGDRDFLNEELAKCYRRVIPLVNTELEHAQSALQESRDLGFVYHNQPIISSEIAMLRGLEHRLRETQLVLDMLPADVLRSSEYVVLAGSFDLIHVQINETVAELAAKWAKFSALTVAPLLNSPLLAIEGGAEGTDATATARATATSETTATPQLRLQTPHTPGPDLDSHDQLPWIRVNFDRELHRLLREAQYLEHLEVESPVELGLVLSEEGIALTRLRTTLESIIKVYETLRTGLRPVERALFRERHSAVLNFLFRGATGLTWLSQGTEDFVNEANDLVVAKLERRLSTVIDNGAAIEEILASWPEHPAVTKAYAYTEEPQSLDDFLALHKTFTKQYQGWIQESSTRIQALVEEVFEASFVSTAAPAWKDYLHDLSTRVAERLHQTATVGLEALLDIVREGTRPLVLIRIEMDAANVTTCPPLSEETFNRSITEHVRDWSETLLAIGSLVPSFDGQASSPYKDVTQSDDLQRVVEEIEGHTRAICSRCNEHRKELERFTFLVDNDIENVYTRFMDTPKIMYPLGKEAPSLVMLSDTDKLESASETSADVASTRDDDDLQPYTSNLFGHMHDLASLGHVPDARSPTAEDFDRIMRIFLKVRAELDSVTPYIDVSWVQLDLEPVCAALRLWAQKWTYRFGEHVLSKCSETLSIVRDFFSRTQDLTSYMAGGKSAVDDSSDEDADGGVQMDDQDAFLTAMNFFHEVDAKYRNIENKVGPLKRTLGMLERYSMELLEDDLRLYESIHEEMADLKLQLTESRKEMIPRVARQAARVAGELRNFSSKLRHALIDLKDSGLFGKVFATDANAAMDLIRKFTGIYNDLTVEGNNLTNLQQLTGGGTTDYPELHEGKKYLAALDEVYVLKQRVSLRNAAFLESKWSDVDLDEISTCVKEQLIAQDSLQACSKAWDVTQGFLEYLQTLDHLVPLVDALRSDTMRLRHWKQILRLVGLENSVDARTMPEETLERLLLLNPIRFGRPIMAIVKQAEHDVSSEALLKSFEEMWMSALFKFRKMKSTTVGNTVKNDDDDEDESAIWLVSDFEASYAAVQDHQISLQTMLSDKSITVFSREITGMQTRLRTVELVLRAWQEVQRLWEMIYSLLFQAGKLVETQPRASARTPGTNKPAQQRRRSTMITSLRQGGRRSQSSKQSSARRGSVKQAPTPELMRDTATTQKSGDLQEESVGFNTLDTTFRTLLDVAQGDPAIMRICSEPGRLQVLQNMRTDLLQCWRGIETWLAERRHEFSRFYFLSAHDVMSVYASCTQPDSINAHISSIFGDIAKITIEERAGSNWSVKGFVGRCGETVEFKAPAWPLVDSAPAVLNNIVLHTNEALKDSLDNVLKEHRENWVLSPLKWDDSEDVMVNSDYSMGWIAGDRLTETVVLAVQLTQTREITEALASSDVAGSLRRILVARQVQLKALQVYGQNVLSSIDVHKVSVLMTIFVHQRDVVEVLLADSNVGPNSFNWVSQLQYRHNEETNQLAINACNGSMDYGFEYVARTHSLVMTPLTERCWLSILQAIQCKTGAACMSGPAYGKATTIRQLSYAAGKSLYELNCTNATESGIIQDWLTGMASTGTWTMFRHVEKLSAPILAVMADSLRVVYDALRGNKSSAVLRGNLFELANTCPCLLTFGNVDGNATFPDSLRPFFRVSMMSAPHLSVIAEVLLLSYNFVHARELAQKLVVFYELAAKLFGENVHDWSVRSLRTVLEFVEARRLACVQKGVSLPELQVFCNALAQYNSARMRSEMERDQLNSLFTQVFGDTTENLERDVVEDADGVYLEHIVRAAKKLSFRDDATFCDGVEELGELLCLRRTIMLVGGPGSGKSARWRTLKEARDDAGKQTTKVIRLNPSALGDRLFGHYTKDEEHVTFKQGLLPQMLTKLNAQRSPLSFVDDDDSECIWIVFDGPLSQTQCQTFMTAMDGGDLQLLDGSKIQVSDNVNFIWEVSDVDWLTADMLPCVGIIRISNDWEARNTDFFVDTWASTYGVTFGAEGQELMAATAKSYLTTMQDAETAIAKNIFVNKENTCLVGIFQTAAALFDAMVKHVCDEDTPLIESKHLIEPCMEFAMMWSFGGILATGSSTAPASRQSFSDWWRVHRESTIPPSGLIWDYYVQPKTGEFAWWGNDVPVFKIPARPGLTPHTCVPTLRTEAFLFVMQMLIESGRPIVLVGPSGAGKTGMLREKLRVLTSGDLADWSPLTIQCNRLIDAEGVWRTLERQLECRSERAYFPRDSSKGLMCCMDDMNMATNSSSAEFLRQLIDHGGVYDERTCVWKDVRDVSLMLSTDTLVDSAPAVTRLYRHAAVLGCPLPDRDELAVRYLQYMKANMNAAQLNASQKSELLPTSQDQEGIQLCETICAATIDLHYRVGNLYMDTMTRSHYVFGPRDLDSVFYNMCRSGVYFRTKAQAVLIWAVECRDTYALRLTDGTDVSRFWDALEKTAHSIMGPEYSTLIGRDDYAPMYRSVSDSSGTFVDGAEDYVAVTPKDRTNLSGVLNTLAKDCSAHHSALDVHVHKGLFYQLNYLIRVLQRPAQRASCLLIGTGANDLAQLGGFVCQYTLEYARDLHIRSTVAFQEEFAELAMKAGTRDKKLMYVVDAMHVSDDTLTTIADFVCSGNISSLLSADHNVAINTLIRPKLVAEGLPISDKMCQSWFVANARKNLRIVLTMPAGARSEKQRYHLRHIFSPILECLDVIWCTPRPRHDLRDLRDLAQAIIGENKENLAAFMMDDDSLENYTHLFANIHSSVLGARAPSPSDEANQQIFVNQALFTAFIGKVIEICISYMTMIEKNRSQLQSGLSHADSLTEEATVMRNKLWVEELTLEEKQNITVSLLGQIGRESWALQQAKTSLQDTASVVKSLKDQLPGIVKTNAAHKAECAQQASALNVLVDKLNDKVLTELQTRPSDDNAINTLSAIIIMLEAPVHPERLDLSWRTGGSRFLANRSEFRERLSQIATVEMPAESLEIAKRYFEAVIMENVPEPVPEALTILHQWATGALTLHDFLTTSANPVSENYASTSLKLKDASTLLGEVQAKTDALNSRIKGLSISYEKSTRVKNDQLGRVRNITEKLERAENFLKAIADQRPIWQERLEEFDVLNATALSRVAIATAAQVYLGPFSKEFRQNVLTHAWPDVLEERGLPTGANETGPTYTCSVSELMTFIASQEHICVWDESWCTDFMKLNHAAVQSTVRFPIMIDPYGAGVSNVIQLEYALKEDHKLVILDATYEEKSINNLVSRAEVAWKTGIPVLIKNIGTCLPAELYDFLQTAQRDERVHVQKYKRPVVFGNHLSRVAADKCSRIYLATREVAFHPPPELSSLLTVINYDLGLDEVSGVVSACLEEACGELVEDKTYSDWVAQRRKGDDVIRTIDELDEGILVELQSLGFASSMPSTSGSDDADGLKAAAAASDASLGAQSDVTAEQLELEAALVAKVQQKQGLLAELDAVCASLKEIADPRTVWQSLSTFGARVFTLMGGVSGLGNEFPMNMQTFLVMFANVVETTLSPKGGAVTPAACLPEVVKTLLGLIESTVTEDHVALVQVLFCIGGKHLDSSLGKGADFSALSPSLARFVFTQEYGDSFEKILAKLTADTRTEIGVVTYAPHFPKMSVTDTDFGSTTAVEAPVPADEENFIFMDDDMRDFGNTAQLDAQINETVKPSEISAGTQLDKLLSTLPVFARVGGGVVDECTDGASSAVDAPIPTKVSEDDQSSRSIGTTGADGEADDEGDEADDVAGDMQIIEGHGATAAIDFPADELKLSELAFLCLDIIEPEQSSSPGHIGSLSPAQCRRVEVLDEVLGWRAPSTTLATSIAAADAAWQAWLAESSPETNSALVEEWAAGLRTPMDTTLLMMLVVRALCPAKLSDALAQCTLQLQGALDVDREPYRKTMPYFVNELVPLLQLPNKIDFGLERSNTVVPILLIQGPDPTATTGVDFVKVTAQSQGLPQDKIQEVVLLPNQPNVWLDTLRTAYAQGNWLIINSVHVLGDDLVELWHFLATIGEIGGVAKTSLMEEDEDDMNATSTAGASQCRIFLTTCVGAELPALVVRSCVNIVCEHAPTLGTTLFDAAAALNDGMENLFSTVSTEIQRVCVQALCICQSLLSARLQSNHPEDSHSQYKQFFGCDIAHVVRELPFFMTAETQDDAAVLGAFRLIAEKLYSGSCDRKIEQTLCRLYVHEWFAENPLDKMGTLIPDGAATKALKSAPQEWVESMRSLSKHKVEDAEFQDSVKPQNLVAQISSVFNGTFTFDAQGDGSEFYDAPEQNTQSIDLQNSIRLLAESILGQLPQELNVDGIKVETAMGTIMLQECMAVNSKIQNIKTRIAELDVRASNSEMPETSSMNEQLASLQRGVVPLSWLGASPTSKRQVVLSTWLYHLSKVSEALAFWQSNVTFNPQPSHSARLARSKIKAGWKALRAAILLKSKPLTEMELIQIVFAKVVKLAYINNPSGFMVAFRQDVARKNNWDVSTTQVQVEPTDAEGRPRSGAAPTNALRLEGVSLISATWDSAKGVLQLSDTDTPMPISLCAVCTAEAPQGEEGMTYTCPINIGNGQSDTKLLVPLPTAEVEDEYIKRGVRMSVNESELVN